MQQIESIRCCCTALLAAPQTTLLYECTFAVFCLDYARVILASSNFRRTEASRDAGRAQTIRYCEDKSTVTRHREKISVHYWLFLSLLLFLSPFYLLLSVFCSFVARLCSAKWQLTEQRGFSITPKGWSENSSRIVAVSSPRPSVILFSKTQFYFVKEGKERKCTRGRGKARA